MPVANSRRLAAQLGAEAAALVELPGTGHCPQEERPGEVAAAILEFASGRGLLA